MNPKAFLKLQGFAEICRKISFQINQEPLKWFQQRLNQQKHRGVEVLILSAGISQRLGVYLFLPC